MDPTEVHGVVETAKGRAAVTGAGGGGGTEGQETGAVSVTPDWPGMTTSESEVSTDALWSGTNKNRDVSTGPLARPFAHSLARGKVNF